MRTTPARSSSARPRSPSSGAGNGPSKHRAIRPSDVAADAVLQLCEREYRSALTKDMPEQIRSALLRQYKSTQNYHERIHAMRGMQIH
ncbi:hypothetical protein DDK22_32760 [Cupriavidus necator]|uniref:Uncharacterized protein n=1 Tax=Cupriavidus necator TaxID=106590 RepID=A0A367P8V3_CUPNE|nr:hypothetical protein DDK22_32760 [Cupriavidus necator]